MKHKRYFNENYAEVSLAKVSLYAGLKNLSA
jgi:hypothetical protein